MNWKNMYTKEVITEADYMFLNDQRKCFYQSTFEKPTPLPLTQEKTLWTIIKSIFKKK